MILEPPDKVQKLHPSSLKPVRSLQNNYAGWTDRGLNLPWAAIWQME
jgi:hypothetical protein